MAANIAGTQKETTLVGRLLKLTFSMFCPHVFNSELPEEVGKTSLGCLRERLLRTSSETSRYVGHSRPTCGFRMRSRSFVTDLARAAYQNNSMDWENKPTRWFWWDRLSMRPASFVLSFVGYSPTFSIVTLSN